MSEIAGNRRPAVFKAVAGEKGGVALCLALAALVGWLGARAVSIGGHTLAANGNWTATKTEAERSLMGAQSFFTEPQALAQGHLDLGAWHGFHEVMLDRPLDPVSLELDFRLTEGAYLAVLFNDRPGEGRSGLRIGWHRRFPNVFFDATDDGEFVRTQRIGLPPQREKGWQSLRLRFVADGVEATIDGGSPLTFKTPIRSPQRLGLRSGAKRVFVDDVVVTGRDGEALRDSFDRAPRARRNAVAGVLLAVALTAAVVAAAGARGGRLRPRLFALVTLELILLIAALAWQPVAARRAASYPEKTAGLVAQEEELRRTELERVAGEIVERHPAKPRPGSRRILFLGSSQTWGAGAARDDEVWVRRLEVLLNDSAPPGLTFECVNAGVSSLRSYHIRPAFEQRWLALEPWAVVVNLANNDRQPEVLTTNLERIVTASRGIGARVVLLLEPNATEMHSQALTVKHQAIQRLGERLDVPVVDLQGFLAWRYDAGFLWWDVVHLTSFGQRLTAGYLHDQLVELGFTAPEGAVEEAADRG